MNKLEFRVACSGAEQKYERDYCLTIYIRGGKVTHAACDYFNNGVCKKSGISESQCDQKKGLNIKS